MTVVCHFCRRRFHAAHPSARYCSDSCRQLAYVERRLEHDPAYLEVTRARSRDYSRRRRLAGNVALGRPRKRA